jgi:hypothetical protein
LVGAHRDRSVFAAVRSFFGSRGVVVQHVKGCSQTKRFNSLYALINDRRPQHRLEDPARCSHRDRRGRARLATGRGQRAWLRHGDRRPWTMSGASALPVLPSPWGAPSHSSRPSKNGIMPSGRAWLLGSGRSTAGDPSRDSAMWKSRSSIFATVVPVAPMRIHLRVALTPPRRGGLRRRRRPGPLDAGPEQVPLYPVLDPHEDQVPPVHQQEYDAIASVIVTCPV